MLHKHTRYRLIAGGVWQVELMWWAGSVRVGFTWALGRVPAVYVKERYYAPYLCNTQMIESKQTPQILCASDSLATYGAIEMCFDWLIDWLLTERFNNVQQHKNSVVVPNFLTIIQKVPVQFSWATSDLWLIQQNKFYWISHRSMVAQLNCTVTIQKYWQTTAKTKRQYSHLRTATARRIQKKGHDPLLLFSWSRISPPTLAPPTALFLGCMWKILYETLGDKSTSVPST